MNLEIKKVFRIEDPIFQRGLWYHGVTGKPTDVSEKLDLSGQKLFMGFEDEIAKDRWRSAASSLEQLQFWFTHEDLMKLRPLGFKLFELSVDVYKEFSTEHYSHLLFQEQGVKNRAELDIAEFSASLLQ